LIKKQPLHGLPRPRKRFGQHFLVDQTAIGQIVDLIHPLETEQVLEIGPGRGALTKPLVSRLERLVAVEIDRDLAAFLRQRFGGSGFCLIEDDILQLDLCEVVREEKKEKLMIVGNLPYNITAPLLFKLLEQVDCVGKAILMLQREVARRLVAQPGSKDYSLLSVLLAMHAEVKVCLEVGHKAFRPVPKVESTVVEFNFESACRYPVQDEVMFRRLVRTAFAQRRKMLRNSLLGLVQQGEREELEAITGRAVIDLTRRPETLSLEEFCLLSDAFTAAGLGQPMAGKTGE
jgi:16S rRNA (adenine1518-N6/adenine1519-N6)-dimethyltransferase